MRISLPMALPGALAFAALTGAGASSQTEADSVETAPHRSWALQVDQDVFFEPAEDKDYTMGVQLDFVGSGFGQELLAFFDRPFGHCLHDLLGVRRTESWHFGFSAFTPRKGPGGRVLAATEPILDDRPYASILFAKFRRGSWDGRHAFFSELTVGVLGTRIAESAQTWIHRKISHDVDPGGWPNQISDGGAPTAAYRAQYQRLAIGDSSIDFGQSPGPGDLTISVDAMAGFYTMARAGILARLGWVASPWPTASFFTSGPAPEVAPTPEQKARGLRNAGAGCGCSLLPDEAYVWLSAGYQGWVYNALLQGQGDGDDPVNLTYADDSPAPLRRGVADLSVGLTVRWGRFGVTWAVFTRHSPLFDGPFSRNHEWGTVRLTLH